MPWVIMALWAKMKSSAVTGTPSSHLKPFLSFHVVFIPPSGSSSIPPFSRVGITSAITGRSLSESSRIRSERKMAPRISMPASISPNIGSRLSGSWAIPTMTSFPASDPGLPGSSSPHPAANPIIRTVKQWRSLRNVVIPATGEFEMDAIDTGAFSMRLLQEFRRNPLF